MKININRNAWNGYLTIFRDHIKYEKDTKITEALTNEEEKVTKI